MNIDCGMRVLASVCMTCFALISVGFSGNGFAADRAHRIAVVSIMNVATSDCLDAWQSQGESGRDVALRECNGFKYQQWALEEVSYRDRLFDGKPVRFRNIGYPNLCLDVEGGNYKDRTHIWLYTCWEPTSDHIRAQLFDTKSSFYNILLHTTHIASQYTGLDQVFSRFEGDMVTWIRPVFAGKRVFDVHRGELHGVLQLYKGPDELLYGGALADLTRLNLKSNQLFVLIKAD